MYIGKGIVEVESDEMILKNGTIVDKNRNLPSQSTDKDNQRRIVFEDQRKDETVDTDMNADKNCPSFPDTCHRSEKSEHTMNNDDCGELYVRTRQSARGLRSIPEKDETSKLESECDMSNNKTTPSLSPCSVSTTDVVNQHSTDKASMKPKPQCVMKQNIPNEKIGNIKKKRQSSTLVATNDKIPASKKKRISKAFTTSASEPSSTPSITTRSKRKKKTIDSEKSSESTTSMATLPYPDPSKRQLFASHFDQTNDDSKTLGRSKRRIKQVIRFDAAPKTYAAEVKLQQLAGKTGSGFLCPKCSEHLSYDATKCFKCGLNCCYVAGTGVVVCRERGEVADERFSSNDLMKVVMEKVKTDEEEKASATVDTVEEGNPTKNAAERTTKAEVKSTVTTNTSKMKKKNPTIHLTSTVIKNVEPVECEVCLQIYPPSYIMGHRKKVHDLNAGEFGCPYCSKIFKSKRERIEHITTMHKGKPYDVPLDVKEKSKSFTYACPEVCEGVHTYTDMRNHLKRYHSSDIFHVMDKVTHVCPFCISEKKTNIIETFTTSQMLSHMKSHHPECNLIGKKLDIRNVPKIPMAEDITEEAPLESTNSSEDCSQPSPFQFEELSIDKLELIFPLSRIVGRRNRTKVDFILSRIDTKLADLDQNMNEIQKGRGINKTFSSKRDKLEDEYIIESKLYNRGVRERTGKAAQEKLEKVNFKERYDENLRRLEYENRTRKRRKRDQRELDYEQLLRTPIYFNEVGRETRHVQNKCSLIDCNLCNGTYAKVVLSDTEEERIDGCLPSSLLGKGKRLLNPSFRKICGEDDIPSDVEIDLNAKRRQNCDRMDTINKKKIDDVISQSCKLKELKSCIEFIDKYNQGPLPNERRNRMGDRSFQKR